MMILLVLAMFIVPLVGGIVIGFTQLAFYRAARRTAESTPSFPILFARGLLIFFICAAILAVTVRLLP